MKKLLCCFLCLLLCMGVAACGKKADTKTETKTNSDSAVKTVIEDTKKLTVDDKEKVQSLKEKVETLKKEAQKDAGKTDAESVERYQNRQAAAAIMEQATEGISKAIESGDKDALEDSKKILDMAQSLWDYKEESKAK